VYVLAHCLLHLGFGHFNPPGAEPLSREWNAACDCMVDDFLAKLKLGRPPHDFLQPLDFSARTEERIYAEFRDHGVPQHYRGDMVVEQEKSDRYSLLAPGLYKPDWQAYLGEGLVAAVTSAVNVAAGVEERLGAGAGVYSRAERARAWFINSYPLLGALASTFRIVESASVCYRMDITVAAVDMEAREIYINPAAGLDEMEMRFVMAHELLHVGLRHDVRQQGRDPYYWNVACDYVINAWLVEMGVGALPRIGVLYDPQLKGESAEAIYDRIVTDLRRYRKLMTMRGYGASDILQRGEADWWAHGVGADLDDFYRRALSQGLVFHEASGRGLLPAGLVEEIRALAQPPIPWDVELAEWFDEHFPPLEMRRSYARPSRRQSSTPDIPRPRWVPKPDALEGRTFGVVLDTSGSMDRTLLAKALGAIASYSVSRDVPAARVVFCDAATYDEGYMPPEDIAGRVRVKGRGGTVLQPGIDLLEEAEDFPKEGPILIITDGYCDKLQIRREHAFLLPEGRHLPFVPVGKVFRIR
jgi:predicted metal-dependent peptidase